MTCHQLLLGLIAGLYLLPASGQIISNPTHYCSYSEAALPAELYLSTESLPLVNQMTYDICLDAGRAKTFNVRAANVPSVTALNHEGQPYLLYNSSYCRRLAQDNPRQLYIMLAHATGHLLMEHRFENHHRLHQESLADEFLGRALFHSNGFLAINSAMGTIMSLPYAYDNVYRSFMDRQAVIRNGWLAEEGLVKAQDNLGYLNSETVQNDLPIRQFELQGCPRWFELDRANFSNCKLLSEVNRQLINALNAQGYSQRSYYSLSNGFAILTPIEQIREDGRALPGAERWQDYPAGKNMEGLLGYLSSLIVPRRGYFRLFVFTVTDRTISNNHQTLNAQSAKSWLQSGGHWLPDDIANLEFTSGHHTNVFLYEFEAPESTKRLQESCSGQLLTMVEHLRSAGLLRLAIP